MVDYKQKWQNYIYELQPVIPENLFYNLIENITDLITAINTVLANDKMPNALHNFNIIYNKTEPAVIDALLITPVKPLATRDPQINYLIFSVEQLHGYCIGKEDLINQFEYWKLMHQFQNSSPNCEQFIHTKLELFKEVSYLAKSEVLLAINNLQSQGIIIPPYSLP
jgi:hypothetical protein